MHAGNESAEEYQRRFPGDESSEDGDHARSRGVCESVQAENCLPLSLSRIEPRGIFRRAQGYARGGSTDSQARGRAVTGDLVAPASCRRGFPSWRVIAVRATGGAGRLVFDARWERTHPCKNRKDGALSPSHYYFNRSRLTVRLQTRTAKSRCATKVRLLQSAGSFRFARIPLALLPPAFPALPR